jgi:hypothetical protein
VEVGVPGTPADILDEEGGGGAARPRRGWRVQGGCGIAVGSFNNAWTPVINYIWLPIIGLLLLGLRILRFKSKAHRYNK